MRGRTEAERGYVLFVVLLVLMILMTAGMYGLDAAQSDYRSSTRFRRSEQLTQAAEAGASHRVAEIAMARVEAGAALATAITWTNWPAAATFAAQPEAAGLAQYQVLSEPVAVTESRPPSGTQIGAGGQTTVWAINGFAVSSAAGAAGERGVSVGVRLWSRGGLSYNDG